MGFRFHRRINLGNGTGINVSKSGISSSWRTRYGTIGSKGFSIRTGIPGLTWRSGFGGKNGGLILLAILLLFGAVIIAYNLVRFTFFVLVWIWNSIFTEEGVNYKFLFSFLAVVAGLSLAVYYYEPTVVSAPAPKPKIVETPYLETDTATTEVTPTKPKRKKPKKTKTEEASSQKAAVADTVVETENIEPVVKNEPTIKITDNSVITQANTSENVSANTLNQESKQDVSKLNEAEKSRAKWYQFRKKRKEKQRNKQEAEADSSVTR